MHGEDVRTPELQAQVATMSTEIVATSPRRSNKLTTLAPRPPVDGVLWSAHRRVLPAAAT